ncbi:polyphosphate polymerase domain-containing protein [Paraliobacillus zengyii]|uniref:polyphosphate polymerase domain-containing protein n=1 Tax=Paraliobacillus zengyii TaxID=2213194 RepID=UPI000DD39469|nr:polyphosphate polymerase domain-containing protein [Paraliobacillus zengyii]
MLFKRNIFQQKQGRRELKHAINKLDCHLLRQNLKHVMHYDNNADEHGKYFIRSVYFDNSEDKVLTEKKEGYLSRNKYRVRLYNHDRTTLKLERKSKRNNLCQKISCPISPEEYKAICMGNVGWMEEDDRSLMRELYIQMHLYQLKPVTVVDYNREVFIYPYGNVRITFDSSIKTSFRNTDILNRDLPMIEALDPNLVVLEVKYDEFLPDVIKKLLQVNDRRLGTYSKYHLSRMYG